MYFSTIINHLDIQGAHCEQRKGRRDQARDYTRKQDTSCGEWMEAGVFRDVTQGHRSDLTAIAEMAKNGESMEAIAREYPGQVIRYPNGIQTIHTLFQGKPPPCEKQVIVLTGQAGAGKSRYANETWPDAFRHTDQSANFFIGYDYQDVAIFDDFTGSQLSLRMMLLLTDYYPTPINIKNSHRWWRAKTIVITSNKEPHEWYPGTAGDDQHPRDTSRYQALIRRLTTICKFTFNSHGQTVIRDITERVYEDAGILPLMKPLADRVAAHPHPMFPEGIDGN